MQDPPPPAQQEAAQYLLTAFRRLVRLSAPSGEQAEQSAEVFVPPSAAATAAGATIDDIDMLVDGPHAYAADKDAHTGSRRLTYPDDSDGETQVQPCLDLPLCVPDLLDVVNPAQPLVPFAACMPDAADTKQFHVNTPMCNDMSSADTPRGCQTRS